MQSTQVSFNEAIAGELGYGGVCEVPSELRQIMRQNSEALDQALTNKALDSDSPQPIEG
jgi:hypothetical protein